MSSADVAVDDHQIGEVALPHLPGPQADQGPGVAGCGVDRLDRGHVEQLDVALELGRVGAVVGPLVAEVAAGQDADPRGPQLAQAVDQGIELAVGSPTARC